MNEMNVWHKWNVAARERLKYCEKNLFHYHFVHSRSHTDWPGIEHVPPPCEARD
jgi:hypothetical protein